MLKTGTPLDWHWPGRLLRSALLCLVRCFYRVRQFDLDHLPTTGGALLVSNHLSFLDGPLLMILHRRPVRPIVHIGNFGNPLLRWWGSLWGAIYIGSGPKAMVRALKEAREAILEGYFVAIFAEGGISRTGQLEAFRPGLLKILEGTGCPAVPVYLDDLWGSIFSFSGGKFFWKWPRRWRQPISVYYGRPIQNPASAAQVRQQMAELGVAHMSDRQTRLRSLPREFIRMCQRRRFVKKLADGESDLTGGETLLRTLILRRLLLRDVLARDETFVGVLLPPSVGGALTNMALVLAGRVPIHLNYTVTSAVLNQCLANAGIRHVLTSRRVMNKLDLKLDAPLVYLEDFKTKVRLSDKILGAVGAYGTPAWLLSRLVGLHRRRGSDIATVIFTSGSTGIPKGVVLTYDNIACNVEAIQATVRLTSRDVVLGILPFFHSFGYTVTLWTPMALDLKGVYHFSPLDARRIGALAKDHGATVLLATPTFLRSFLKRCTPEQFATMDVVVAGAEKLPSSLADAFEARFHVRPVEGYGCTELSPLVSLNIPHSRSSSRFHIERKDGSVGKTIPGVAAKVVHPDTGAALAENEEGMLLIKGPNVMEGYLHQPELTASVVRDGWYRTGDIARIDEDGFIFITGRESRFSKIGGEMVPHVQIEDALMKHLGADEDEGLPLIVTAVDDERKGERLIVLHKPMAKSPADLCADLVREGLPNLYIPSPDSFFQVRDLPLLGTGKIDLRAARELAQQLAGGKVSALN
ncbi:MAG TPA: AMP-binding protein [Pirellulaceae bacterium]